MTRLVDVIIPEVFAAYITQRTKELSVLIDSGIATSSAILDGLVTQGGRLINMPFWAPLSGSDQVIPAAGSLTVEKIEAKTDVAALLIRAQAWGAHMLAGALAGSSPMNAIGAQVAQWWATQEQRVLLSILEGVFSGPLAVSHVNDISGATGAAGVISGPAVLDTKQLLGDAAGQLTAIAMHSAVLTALQKQNLIVYIPNSQGVVNIPTYMGYRVLVDDGCPNDNGVYSTFLFANGSFGRGDGVPVDLAPVDIERDALASEDILVNRRAYVLHPFGIKFNDIDVTTPTPTNANLADPQNWTKVYEDKAIGLACLLHRV